MCIYVFTRNDYVVRRGWHNIRNLSYSVSSCDFHNEHFSDPFVCIIVLERSYEITDAEMYRPKNKSLTECSTDLVHSVSEESLDCFITSTAIWRAKLKIITHDCFVTGTAIWGA